MLYAELCGSVRRSQNHFSSQVHSTGLCHLSVFVCYTARCLLEAFCPLLAVSMALTPPEARSTAACL
jgi:hypothetical protein